MILSSCFSVRCSVTFHLKFVHIMFSSVWVVTVWEKAVHLVDHMFNLYLLKSICNFSYFSFWFWGRDKGSNSSSSWSLPI